MFTHLSQNNLFKNLSFPRDLRCHVHHVRNPHRPLGLCLDFLSSLPLSGHQPRTRTCRGCIRVVVSGEVGGCWRPFCGFLIFACLSFCWNIQTNCPAPETENTVVRLQRLDSFVMVSHPVPERGVSYHLLKFIFVSIRSFVRSYTSCAERDKHK